MTPSTTPVLSTNRLAGPPHRSAYAGPLALGLALAGLGLILANDPYWLAVPVSLVAAGLGRYALSQGDGHSVAAHLGLNLGLLNILLWIVAILVVQHALGIEIWLLELPVREP